jgi:hypothetical protein
VKFGVRFFPDVSPEEKPAADYFREVSNEVLPAFEPAATAMP